MLTRELAKEDPRQYFGFARPQEMRAFAAIGVPNGHHLVAREVETVADYSIELDRYWLASIWLCRHFTH
jgi:hypothetical protein